MQVVKITISTDSMPIVNLFGSAKYQKYHIFGTDFFLFKHHKEEEDTTRVVLSCFNIITCCNTCDRGSLHCCTRKDIMRRFIQ